MYIYIDFKNIGIPPMFMSTWTKCMYIDVYKSKWVSWTCRDDQPFGNAPSADNKAGAVLHLKAIPSAKVDDLFHGKV